jgi:replicative DNA helicase
MVAARKAVVEQQPAFAIDKGMVHTANALIEVVLTEPDLLNEISLTSDAMPLPWQQDVWTAIQFLWDAKSKLDIIILSEHLHAAKVAPPEGDSWLALVASVMRDTIGSRKNAQFYADKLNLWQRRARCAEIGSKLIDATAAGKDGSDEAIRELMAMNAHTKMLDGPISESISEAVDYLDSRHARKGQVQGVPYGIAGLDRLLCGMENSHLITIAARPAMGKTAFALCLCEVNRGIPVGFISTEQPRREMINRLVSIHGGIDSHRMRTGELTDEDWVKATHAYGSIGQWPLYMADKAAPHLNDVVRQARKWKHRYGIKLLIVDYMQRIKVPDADSRAQEVGEIASTLKNVARELEIPVVALSQINRGVESRENKRPIMSDLRESGDIEQESDIIITMYRDEVYHKNENGKKGEAELGVIKNRHGPIGHTLCHYEGKLLRFTDFGVDEDAPADRFDRGEPIRSDG